MEEIGPNSKLLKFTSLMVMSHRLQFVHLHLHPVPSIDVLATQLQIHYSAICDVVQNLFAFLLHSNRKQIDKQQQKNIMSIQL